MKKCAGVLLFLCLCLAIILSVAAKKKVADNTEKSPKSSPSKEAQIATCSIQTGNWEEGCPKQYVLASETAFAKFDEEHFSISQTEEFCDEIGRIDADFFSKYILLCALVTTNSGSDRFSVSCVEVLEDGRLEMAVSKEKAKRGTADMAEWFLFARINRQALEAMPERFELRIRS